ncbi:Abi family protein [Kribbella sp. NPDC059898]|uniref:Abi family protein n=1 Tax=Kribbella sp. NPDC059898 TaxID=3346995 RepID=UPI0036557DC4
MATYAKPHLAFADRLSGYWYIYRRRLGHSRRDDRFVEGTTFRQVVRLYDTDRRLKLHLLDALERIEIAVRVLVGFTLGRRGAYAHLSPGNLDGRFTRSGSGRPSTHDRWLRKVLAAQSRSSEDFVQHFQGKYDGRLPVWVVTEILDFGSMSYLFQGLKAADRNEIAGRLGVVDQSGGGNGTALANWLRVLNYVRNVCAHHSRLWNRNLVDQLAPRHLRSIPDLHHLARGEVSHFRIYSTLCIIAFLLSRTGHGPQWTRQVRDLLSTEIPSCGRGLHELGFPAGWTAEQPWKG